MFKILDTILSAFILAVSKVCNLTYIPAVLIVMTSVIGVSTVVVLVKQPLEISILSFGVLVVSNVYLLIINYLYARSLSDSETDDDS